jgi:hypothetical protein
MFGWSHLKEETSFFSQVLGDFRKARMEYHYDLSPEDTLVLAKCSKDMRAVTWSTIPTMSAWWLSGKLQRVLLDSSANRAVSLGCGVIRLYVAANIFKAGILLGSHKQAEECLSALITLPTPLGGEIAAIVREKDPKCSLLKGVYDRERPRIASDKNRIRKIEALKTELEAAKDKIGGVARDKFQGIQMENGINGLENISAKHGQETEETYDASIDKNDLFHDGFELVLGVPATRQEMVHGRPRKKKKSRTHKSSELQDS